MRLDSTNFNVENKSTNKEPIFVVELAFDSANTDLHYLTSKPVTGLAGNIINNTLKIVSSTSQKINPDKALSTIGSIKFECLDIGLTELQRTKLTAGDGLNSKRVRVYAGYSGMLWSDFQLVQTQVVNSSIQYKDGVYTFQCADIQRVMRKKIFTPKETSLVTSITATDDSISVFSTSDFELVYQVPSVGGKTLLRGLQSETNDDESIKYPSLIGIDKIGLIKIENDDDFEIALWTAKDDATNTFSGLIRGIFGTTALPVNVDAGATNQNAPKITEYIYLEMPAVKAIYALMTGSLYGHAGEFIPDHWNLGISTDYIQTSAFINIGSDIWDLTDDDKGYPISIRGPEEEDGKKYIEENIFYMLGIYAPILSTGELSLKRIDYVGSKGSYDRLLNETNIVKYSDLKIDLKSIINRFILKWNWDERRDKFTRTSIFFDQNSIDIHGASDNKVVELKTLHGSRSSDYLIGLQFDAIGSRYSHPPLLLSLDLTPDQNDLEVGDVVRVNLPYIEDPTSELSETLNRNFEVQSVKHDWITGNVKVQLFGSSANGNITSSLNTDTVSDAFISSQGTEINETNFPGQVSSSGGITTVTGTIDLAGDLDLNSVNAIYYCTEDLTINASATITVNLNTQIRVKGFFQINGNIDGAGRGFAGGVADYVFENAKDPVASNLGQIGIGTTQAQGGMRHSLEDFAVSYYGVMYIYPTNANGKSTRFDSHSPRIITGEKQNEPILNITDNIINGLPGSLIGTSGSSGGPCVDLDNNNISALGGNGGNSGAGLAIFSKGMMFGTSGNIDLSGDDGLPGEVLTVEGYDLAKAGGGAGGAPGALIVGILDSSQTFQTFNGSILSLNHGKSPEVIYDKFVRFEIGVGAPASSIRTYYLDDRFPWEKMPFSSGDGGGGSLKKVENVWQRNAYRIFLDTSSTPQEDLPGLVENDPTFTLTEYTNTPVTPDGNVSTVEVSVTPPSDSNYSYSRVFYKKPGDTVYKGDIPASPEALIEFPSDGSTWEIYVSPVSKKGRLRSVYFAPMQTITMTDVNGRTDAQLAAIYPFNAITNLGLNEAGTSFTGPGAMFQWDHDNGEKVYFNYYEIEMYSGAQLLRTEKSVSPFYEYSYDKNVSDYQKIVGSDGKYLTLEIRVRAVSKYYNNLSSLYAGVQVTFTATASYTNDSQNLRYITSRAEIESSIVLASKTSDWSGINNDNGNRPADNADVTADNTANDTANVNGTPVTDVINDIASKTVAYTQESQPTGSLGDLWYKPSTNEVKRFNGSTWEIFATNGATWDGNVSGQPSTDILYNNLLDTSGWIAGAQDGAIQGFTPTGYDYQAKHILGIGPFNTNEILWEGNHDNFQNGLDVGFYTDLIKINPGKIYRLSVWVKCSGQLADASVSYGFTPDGSIQIVSNGNIINTGTGFIHGDQVPELDKWFLLVWYVFPFNYLEGDGIEDRNGFYDTESGEPILTTTNDVRFTNNTITTMGMMCNSSGDNTINKTQFARPRIDLVNGNEPSILALIGKSINLENLPGIATDAQLGLIARQPGHVRAGNMQLIDGTDDITVSSSDMTVNVSQLLLTYGPTGGPNTDTVWPALDIIPANASILICDLKILIKPSDTTSNSQAIIDIAKGGQTKSINSEMTAVRRMQFNSNGADIDWITETTRIHIPLNSNNEFQMSAYLENHTMNSSSDRVLYYRGFITD